MVITAGIERQLSAAVPREPGGKEGGERETEEGRGEGGAPLKRAAQAAGATI